MNIDDLLKRIETSEIAKHKDFILQSIRPAIDIIKNKDAKPYLACSRFGGIPDLPAGSLWPTYNSTPYRFLGQINFADVPQSKTDLPSNGLLSFFVSDFTSTDELDEEQEEENEEKRIFWNDDGYIHTIYTPEVSKLKPISPPANCYVENPSEVVLAFHETIDLPYDEYQVKNWPFPFDSNEAKIYDEIRVSLHRSEDYLLGYPSHNSLGYNPAPSEDWYSLLTLDSDEKLNWYWHDGDKLMVFIEIAKLKKYNFDLLKADAG